MHFELLKTTLARLAEERQIGAEMGIYQAVVQWRMTVGVVWNDYKYGGVGSRRDCPGSNRKYCSSRAPSASL